MFLERRNVFTGISSILGRGSLVISIEPKLGALAQAGGFHACKIQWARHLVTDQRKDFLADQGSPSFNIWMGELMESLSAGKGIFSRVSFRLRVKRKWGE